MRTRRSFGILGAAAAATGLVRPAFAVPAKYLHRDVSLITHSSPAAFEDAAVREPKRRALGRKVSYVADPDNRHPRNCTGHIRATLKDGRVIDFRQPHMRGGAQKPLNDADIIDKYRGSCAFGGFDDSRAGRRLAALDHFVAGGKVDLKEARA